jgi:hypothetical protein
LRIGLDFDRVLFDTDSFDEYYKDHVKGLHHVEDPAPVKYGVYDPDMHAELCGIPKERIWKVFEHDLSQFLYDDIDLLDRLDHELIIVTRGHDKFQRSKVKASNIADKVQKVFVVQEEAKDSIDIDLLVDDSSEELERIDVPGIMIERPEEGLEKVLEKVKEFEA